MNRSMTKWCLLALTVLGLSALATEPIAFEYFEGRSCTIGGDLRVRWTFLDRDVRELDFGNTQPSGPGYQYLRVRTRVWGCFDVVDDVKFHVGLTNEWRYYSSSPAADNNDGVGTWEFPDEVVFDKLALQIDNIMDTDWSVMIGRQNIILGNGMVMLEGNTGDVSRTIYFDGVVLTYAGEDRNVKLFGAYNHYKDRTLPVINDRDRVITWADTLVLGIYWTEKLDKLINADVYYMYVELDDEDGSYGVPWGNQFNGVRPDGQLNMAGVRLFGQPHDLVKYSVEFCQQFGSMEMSEGDADADMKGQMFDARLGFSCPPETLFAPTLDLEYTYFSGEDASDSSDFEGWFPLFDAYPKWREELTAWSTGAVWRNMHQYRAALGLNLTSGFENAPKVKLTTAYAYQLADEENYPGSTGDERGHLVSAFLDIQLLDNVSVALEGAHMFTGDYSDQDDCSWMRAQTIIKF